MGSSLRIIVQQIFRVYRIKVQRSLQKLLQRRTKSVNIFRELIFHRLSVLFVIITLILQPQLLFRVFLLQNILNGMDTMLCPISYQFLIQYFQSSQLVAVMMILLKNYQFKLQFTLLYSFSHLQCFSQKQLMVYQLRNKHSMFFYKVNLTIFKIWDIIMIEVYLDVKKFLLIKLEESLVLQDTQYSKIMARVDFIFSFYRIRLLKLILKILCKQKTDHFIKLVCGQQMFKKL
ncbi:unnamed protein product [Paramecium primaurelia]|uniref:Transmembrane protein n=1 Tax=Paramecium primaurelia TaxID=5886 RepID=A0A8S1PPU4_PARPR|nr:unnamed protein product [Paramecium primaurelia]